MSKCLTGNTGNTGNRCPIDFPVFPVVHFKPIPPGACKKRSGPGENGALRRLRRREISAPPPSSTEIFHDPLPVAAIS